MAELFGILCGLALTVFWICLFVPSWLWIAMAVYRTFEISAAILVLACIAAGPFSLIRRLRGGIASLYLFSCLILGFLLWIDSGLSVLDIWGRPWVFFGILLGLFAVIPEALVACIAAHRWLAASDVPIIIGVMISLRVAAGFLSAPARPFEESRPTELPRDLSLDSATPTAAQPAEPDNLAILAAQMQQLIDGKRRVVMYPKGTSPPTTLPQNSAATGDKQGNIYVFRPDLITRSAIKKAAENNTLPEILGDATMGTGVPDKSAIPPDRHAEDATQLL